MRHAKFSGDHLIPTRRLDREIKKKEKDKGEKKERIYWIVNFAFLADHRVRIEGNKKRDKYLDLAREVKKKSLEIESALGTIPKSLVTGLEFGIEKRTKLNIKSGKREITKEKSLQIKKKSERLEKRKITSTTEYWKRTTSNERRWKKEK